MGKLTAEYISRLENSGVKVIDSQFSENGGHIIVADIVHCSNGYGRKWVEERPLTLSSSQGVFRYLDDIS